ncbi:hypothetical protein D3C87_88430 [compost metagenome]
MEQVKFFKVEAKSLHQIFAMLMLPHILEYVTIVKMRFKFLLNNDNTFSRGLKNEKGQVALFIALIFQILFLFFAMVINVGLLVHHKINLQNSVDLAAYYGAMKQAENMNAIGHVNYQIRQSWKLLSWRYRAIGSAGDFNEHPYNKRGFPRLQGGDGEDTHLVYSQSQPDFYDAPPFCATYVPFKPMPPNENTCKDMSRMATIHLFKVPQVIAPFIGISVAMRSAAFSYRAQALQQCRFAGTYNYILLGTFIVAFNVDQGDRSLFISQLSRSMSSNTDDFWDVDGGSVKTGIQKTLENNLTVANREGLSKFEVYNSLGSERCNAASRAGTEPPKWLTPVRIAPAFAYVDTDCGDSIRPVQRAMPDDPNDPNQLPKHYAETGDTGNAQLVKDLAQFIGFREGVSPYNFTLGVEKNPWCMAYVGVKAESTPNIPFSLGAIKLVARSFAKPFGGRIGPWYKSKWSPGSLESNAGERVDPLAPPRMTDKSLMANPRDPTRAPNYSRFVGDQYGIKTRNFHYQFGKAIYELDPRWKDNSSTALADVRNADIYNDDAPNFEHWTRHLPFRFNEKGSGNGDILAWSSAEDKPSRMRDLELAAILPDNFDMAYYSIDPDFYNNYYQRISNGFLKSSAGSSFDKLFRPDIGYHKGYSNGGLDKFSIKDQYKVLKSYTVANLDFANKLTYVSKQWDHLLTGWTTNTLLDFSLNTQNLGKCYYPTVDGDELPTPTSGNCVVGGTSGYSVKMVSSDYLKKQDLQLGGDGAGQGPLLNPPPEDF